MPDNESVETAPVRRTRRPRTPTEPATPHKRRPILASKLGMVIVETYLAEVDRNLANLKKAVADLKASLS